MTSFSVLICTYNRPEMLASALAALLDRTSEKPDQVVVVNGGDERSDQIIQEYQARKDVEVSLVKTVNKNLAASRNVGLPYCSGDIVAMTDDDAEVFPDWVTQMKRVHVDHPEAGGVGGAVLGSDSSRNLLSRIADVIVFPVPLHPGYVGTLAGVNVSYKRAVLQRIGKQDETLFRGEDVDFNWRIREIGYEIYFSPEIKVIHRHRPTLRGLMQQFYMYGRAYHLVRRKWPGMYCVYPQHFSRPRDILKLVHFLLSSLSDPFKLAMKLPGWKDRLLALPAIYTVHLAWKGGMIIQQIDSRHA